VEDEDPLRGDVAVQEAGVEVTGADVAGTDVDVHDQDHDRHTDEDPVDHVAEETLTLTDTVIDVIKKFYCNVDIS
jgi:hypothetical protein